MYIEPQPHVFRAYGRYVLCWRIERIWHIPEAWVKHTYELTRQLKSEADCNECTWERPTRCSLWLIIYLFTYLLTYSLVQSPWEANCFAASQDMPRISRNPKVHCRTHKCPPPVPILGQPNPVHIPTSHLLEIHPNIIHPSMPRPPQRFLSLRFHHQDPIHPPLLTRTRHMPSPSHSSRFYHPHNIGWGIQIM